MPFSTNAWKNSRGITKHEEWQARRNRKHYQDAACRMLAEEAISKSPEHAPRPVVHSPPPQELLLESLPEQEIFKSLLEEDDWMGLEYCALPPLRPVPSPATKPEYTGPLPARPHEPFDYPTFDIPSQDDMETDDIEVPDQQSEQCSGDSVQDQDLWCPRPQSNMSDMSKMTTETLIDTTIGTSACAKPQRLHAFYRPLEAPSPINDPSSDSPNFFFR